MRDVCGVVLCRAVLLYYAIRVLTAELCCATASVCTSLCRSTGAVDTTVCTNLNTAKSIGIPYRYTRMPMLGSTKYLLIAQLK